MRANFFDDSQVSGHTPA